MSVALEKPDKALEEEQRVELRKLRQLLMEAEKMAETSGREGAAEAKCSEARDVMQRLTELCRESPTLETEAKPLLRQLKALISRLQRRRSANSAALQHAEEEETEGLQADDNPFAFRLVEKLQESQLAEALARETELDKLAQDMVDLENIFKDLNAMVAEQSEKVQLIEDAVTEAQEKVEEGNEKLEEAVVHQRASRKKRIIIIVVAAVAVLILALIIVLSVTQS